MQQEQLIVLLTKELSGQLSQAEKQELETQKLQAEEEMLVAAMVSAMEAVTLTPVAVGEAANDKAIAAIVQVDTNLEQPQANRFSIPVWMKVAAIILVLAAGAWLWLGQKSKPGELAVVKQQTTDIAPASQTVKLTIGDSTPIELSQQQSGILIQKNITYAGGEVIAAAGKTLTLTVPRGGKYNVTLADGSKVWLNAESRLQFPSRFTAGQREVLLTGEAYFEIAPDEHNPFRVRSATQVVEVLGTSFNINAYADEPAHITTLLSGKIKINTTAHDNSLQSSVVLTPGQQATQEAGKKLLVSKADIEAALAWKEGVFHFEGADVKAVMRELKRWYDIEVVFEHTSNPARFQGEVGKQLMLKEVLEILTESKIKYTLEGRKLIIH